MKIYIAGPMRGYPNFNFPAFFDTEEWLRAKGYDVFNPARADNEKYGTDISMGNVSGSEEQAAAQHGLTIREALGRDADFITQKADAIYMLVGWENSSGAFAEWSLARAMHLKIFYQAGLEDFEYEPDGIH